MKSLIISTLALAGVAVAVPAFAFPGGKVAAPAGIELVANKYECFTDDGYGRKFPCSARYKRENPQWRNSNECWTDEGNGRWSPCSTFLKRPAAQQKN